MLTNILLTICFKLFSIIGFSIIDLSIAFVSSLFALVIIAIVIDVTNWVKFC